MTKKDGRSLARALDAEVPPGFDDDYRGADRISPSEPAWILLGGEEGSRRRLVLGRFGFARPDRKGLLFNARVETVHRLPTFRDAFVRRRCLVPVDGFWEWVGEPGARRPVCFHRPDGGVLLLHGLYQEEIDERTGEHKTTFTVLTTAPNAVVGKVHDRMPVLAALEASASSAWLGEGAAAASFDARRLLDLLGPAPDDLLVADEPLPRPPPREPRIKLPRNPTPVPLDRDGSDEEPARGEQLKLF